MEELYQVNHMSNNSQTILVTGSAGFIGSNLVLRLLESEEPLNIVGLDNLNDYYDPSLNAHPQLSPYLRRIRHELSLRRYHHRQDNKMNTAIPSLLWK